MVVDPSPILACAATWQPRASWASWLRPPYDTLVGGARGLDATLAWSNVATMMGDTRAAPLALACCLYAETLLPEGVEDRRLHAHRDLCLLDLGLATAPGPVPIKALGDPDTVARSPDHLAAWIERALIPFDGSLARAAWFALRLGLVRTGALEGPAPTPADPAP